MLHNTFLEVGRQIEEEAAGLLALQPLALPRRFEEHDGLWRGMPVHIRTHAYRGESVRYGRVAMVSGQDLQIANLLYLPHPLPIPTSPLFACLKW